VTEVRPPEADSPRTWWQRLWQQIKRFWLLIVLLGTLSGILADVDSLGDRFLRRSPTRPMSGDLNIAVGDFTVLEPGGEADRESSLARFARGLADSVFADLPSELAPLEQRDYQVEVWKPEQTGDVTDMDPQGRARKMQARALKLDAQVIISGVLDNRTGDAKLDAEFYIPESTLPDAGELTGLHRFENLAHASGDLRQIPEARGALRAELLQRMSGLARFVHGLGLYRQYSFQQAYDQFMAAEAAWRGPGGQSGQVDGLKVLYLFLGNTVGKLARSQPNRDRYFDRAAGYYERARTIDKLYGRAYVGLAELEFHRSSRGCRRGHAEQRGLEKSIRTYHKALLDNRGPSRSTLEAKAAFGLGRVYYCLSTSGLSDRWKGAENWLQKVVDEYVKGNFEVQELASESFGLLALIHWPTRGKAEGGAQNNPAARYYKVAADLSRSCDRRRLFYRQLTRVDRLIGDIQAARQAQIQAKKPEPYGPQPCRLARQHG
jgi:tetratricopeptide (TPR) repeat protein